MASTGTANAAPQAGAGGAGSEPAGAPNTAAPGGGVRWKRAAVGVVLLVAMCATVLMGMMRVTSSDMSSRDGAGGGVSPTMSRLSGSQPTAEQLAVRATVAQALESGMASLDDAWEKMGADSLVIDYPMFDELLGDVLHASFETGLDASGAPAPLVPILKSLRSSVERVQVNSSVLFPLLFRRFDADGDGVVQRAEVQAMDKVIERTLTEGGSMAAVFKVADANDDGLLQRNTEVVPLLLDVLQMYLRAGEQLIDVGVELFEHEAPTLLTLAGLPPGHSVSLDDLLAMIPDGVYEAAESNYVMTASPLMQSPQVIATATQRIEEAQAGLLASGLDYTREDLARVIRQYLDDQMAKMPAPSMLVKLMSQFMPPTYPKPAPAGSSEAPAMSPYDLDVLARVLDADVPPLSAAAVEALDTNSDGSVSSEELSAVLTLVRSLLPTDYDKVALSALLARYSSPPPSGQPPSPHLRGLIQQQQQNQAPPPNTQLTDAARRKQFLGRVLVSLFPLSDGNADGLLSAEEAASMMIRSSRAVADVFHTVADVFIDVDAKPILQAALAVAWPPSMSRETDAISLPEVARVTNTIMGGLQYRQPQQQGAQQP